jgi:hypothetical protein
MADMKTDETIGTTFVLVLLLLIATAVLVILAEAAVAATIAGSRDDFGLVRLASIPLESASQLGIVAPVIGIVLLGIAIVFGFSMAPAFTTMVTGALLLLGVALYPVLFQALGAELPPGVLP